MRTKTRRLWIPTLAALASLALLAPAGSARAATRYLSQWCETTPGSGVGQTLKPGQTCNFWPLPTIQVWSNWDVVKAGSGVACVAVTKSPPYDSRVPLDGWGNPTSWNSPPWSGCTDVHNRLFIISPGYSGAPFGAIGGQATLLNFSSATIRVRISAYNGVFYYA
jgi:hypothetical protein